MELTFWSIYSFTVEDTSGDASADGPWLSATIVSTESWQDTLTNMSAYSCTASTKVTFAHPMPPSSDASD